MTVMQCIDEFVRKAELRVPLYTNEIYEYVKTKLPDTEKATFNMTLQRYEKRNPDLDPQLIWRGKYDGDDTLTVQAPPLYIQEKIHPKTLVEDLMCESRRERNSQAGRLSLFSDFNGIPSGVDFVTSAPFDIFNDTLRGFLNVSMDMYDCPDELLTAVNAATRVQVRYIRNLIRTGTVKIVGFMLHNGFDSFMSKEQFETFYWPGLKASIDACIENDVIPWIYVEDSFMAKLDIIERDVPAHKVIFTFTGKNDLKAIKERFGGKYCLKGGLLASVIEYGSTEDVEKMVREAIDIYAPGGGLILDTDVALDNAKPENLRTLFDIAHNYIKY